MEKIEPTNEHRWLQRLVGEWQWQSEMGGENVSGKARVRSLGGLWIVCEFDMPDFEGKPGTALITLGYNIGKQRHEGTFVASMMDFQWVYDGQREGDRLNLDTQGPAMDDPTKQVPYRDVVEIESDDRWYLRALMQKDGAWHEFMTTTYRRVK
ncbi:DUF1579 domain-containing protein [Vulgatibacter sp.]|uniref:DUF1579 domain-containing protein n=1 Tax=Vulgatibacter sp. TaxID=1971226 RepID=UPI003562EB59